MKLFILNGPTASGKSALMEYLLAENSDYLEPLISFTTRCPKKGEQEGRDYYFINRDQYLEYLKKNQVVEKISYLDHVYGLTRGEIERVDKTQKNGIAIMNREGVQKLKATIGYPKVISIFIYRDLSQIFSSIMRIYPGEQEKMRRMELVKAEILEMNTCDHVVYNISSLDNACKQLTSVIRQEIESRPIELDIQPGQRYRDGKGNTVEIIAPIAEHTENGSRLVIYRNLTSLQVHARTYESFCGKREIPGKASAANRYERV